MIVADPISANEARTYSHEGRNNFRLHNVIPFDENQITHPANRSRCEPGSPSPSLATYGRPPAIALRADASRSGEALTPSPDATGRVRLRDAGFNVLEECAPTLDAGAPHSVASLASVRRLTPRECERLQGFPDDWSLVPYRGRPAADGPRYRAIGNSMAVPVMRWIGVRIALCEEALRAVGVAA